MAPSKHIGLAVREMMSFWAVGNGFARWAALWTFFGEVAKLDFEFSLGEKSVEEVTRILKAWGVSPRTAERFVTERMAEAV